MGDNNDLKRVLVFGAFDPLHEGHRDFFRQASSWGDHLTVVVARDDTIRFLKSRRPFQDEDRRLGVVRRLEVVDEAVLGNPSYNLADQLEIIDKIRPDLICLGYDQSPGEKRLKELLTERGLGEVEVKTLEPHRPERYKSTKLRKDLLIKDK